MKLYYNPVSPYSRKVLMTCYEKNIEFDGEIVNLFDPKAHAAYKNDVTPLGKVPFLVRDDGWKIPESTIIIDYLDHTYRNQGPALIPEDRDQARQVRFHDRVADLYMLEPAGNLFFENMKPESDRNKEFMAKWEEHLQISLNLFNKHMEGKKFVFGDSLTLADFAPMSGMYLLELLGRNLGDWPHARAWWETAQKRPSWQRITEEGAPILAALKG